MDFNLQGQFSGHDWESEILVTKCFKRWQSGVSVRVRNELTDSGHISSKRLFPLDQSHGRSYFLCSII